MTPRRTVDPNPFGSWNTQRSVYKHQEVYWIWEGFIPWSGVTLLTGAPRLGKSTLVSLLLERRCQGGQLLGQPVEAGTTIVVTEEDQAVWARRQERRARGPARSRARRMRRRIPRWGLRFRCRTARGGNGSESGFE